MRLQARAVLKSLVGESVPQPMCFGQAYEQGCQECKICIVRPLCRSAFKSRAIPDVPCVLNVLQTLRAHGLAEFAHLQWWTEKTLHEMLKKAGAGRHAGMIVRETIRSPYVTRIVDAEPILYKMILKPGLLGA